MKIKNILLMLCRILLGGLFVFSGFVKSVDPMGTALKLEEYFSAFGFDFLHGSEYFFSVVLSSAEMVLGLLLIFSIRLRAVSTLTSIFVLCFAMFTLFIALTDPVDDCGCFGEVIKLSNWGTFIKNILLFLPLSIIIMANAWVSIPRQGNWRDFLWFGVFIAVSVGINVYSIRHLPIIDFFPYKIGVNIPEAITGLRDREQEETKLMYRDKTTGKVVEFAMTDTTWYDSSRWEYVDTIVSETKGGPGKGVGDFAVLDFGEDITLSLLSREGVLFMLCISDPATLEPACARALCDAAREAFGRNYKIIAVTPVPLSEKKKMLIDQNTTVEYFNIDDVTLKSLLRAPNGLVVFRSGTIVDKKNCRDIPLPGRFTDYARESAD